MVVVFVVVVVEMVMAGGGYGDGCVDGVDDVGGGG